MEPAIAIIVGQDAAAIRSFRMTRAPFLLLMLEDEVDRLDRFRAILEKYEETIEWRHWRTAGELSSFPG